MNDRIEGAILGAVFMTVLGQVPPFTALPEELVTLPVGAMVGGVLGKKKILNILRI